MKIFISPPRETDWRLDTDEVASAVKQAWPSVALELVQNPQSSNALVFSMEQEGRSLVGSFARDGQTVHLDGEVMDCAHFALWFRARLAELEPLIFYDEAFSTDVVLAKDTTVHELVQPFLAEPRSGPSPTSPEGR